MSVLTPTDHPSFPLPSTVVVPTGAEYTRTSPSLPHHHHSRSSSSSPTPILSNETDPSTFRRSAPVETLAPCPIGRDRRSTAGTVSAGEPLLWMYMGSIGGGAINLIVTKVGTVVDGNTPTVGDGLTHIPPPTTRPHHPTRPTAPPVSPMDSVVVATTTPIPIRGDTAALPATFALAFTSSTTVVGHLPKRIGR